MEEFKTSAILNSYKLLETIIGRTGGDPKPVVTFDLANPTTPIPPNANLLQAKSEGMSMHYVSYLLVYVTLY
jgi:hypothetical protein